MTKSKKRRSSLQSRSQTSPSNGKTEHNCNRTDHNKESIGPQDIKTAILLYSGIEGKALVDEVSDFFQEDPDLFIGKLGLIYFTALGQGNDYHRGFFGPLPIPNKQDYVSFVYTTIVTDRQQTDPRAKGKSYVIVCLIFLKSDVPKFLDRECVETTFEDVFAAIADVSEIDRSLTNRLKHYLVKATGN